MRAAAGSGRGRTRARPGDDPFAGHTPDPLPIPPVRGGTHPASVDELPPAEEFPGLYRAILDRVARLEVLGARPEAAKIRADATRAYSSAWDHKSRKKLDDLLRRSDRAIEARSRNAAPSLHHAGGVPTTGSS